MTAEQIDERLAKLACQIVCPDLTGKLSRFDTAARHWDRHTFENDRANVRTFGVHVRRARIAEFDWTPDGSPIQTSDRTDPPLAKPRKGDLYFEVRKHIPPLWLSVHPARNNGVYLQGFWRGDARVKTRLRNGEEVWLCSGEELKAHARFCRRNHFFDMAICDRFKSIVAGIVYSETLVKGRVQ